MNKKDFSIVGNEGTDNQGLAKGSNCICKVPQSRTQCSPDGREYA